MSRKKEKIKGNIKNRIFIVFLLIILVLVSMSSAILLFAKKESKGRIMKNVFVENINVSKLTKKQAKKELVNKFKYKDLVLRYNDISFTKGLEEIGFSYDIDKAVEKAYEVGKSNNIIKDLRDITKILLGEKINIPIENKNDLKNIDEFLSDVESSLNKEPKNAKVMYDGRVNIIRGESGYVLDLKKLKKDIENGLKDYDGKDIVVDIKLVEKEPRITSKDLSRINGVIATYSSRYQVGQKERSFNVHLTAEKVNSELLMPGEQMSFLKLLGDISVQNGFKNAPIIVNNEYKDGIGGGVCQVSSTLYNALLMSGMKIVSRTNHSFPIGYIPIGRDATVATQGPDLIYENPYDFPVYIITNASNGIMSASVLGDVENAKVYTIVSNVVGETPPTLKYENDNNLPFGKEVVEDKGHIGYVSETYKIRGNEKILVSKDRYQMTPQVIKVGVNKDLKDPEAPQPKAQQGKQETPVAKPESNSNENQDVIF